jgi:hypothetical protein
MSSKGHRQGGKFRGHTTIIEASASVLDALVAMTMVTGISIGIIKKTKSVANGTVVTHKPTISGMELKVRGNKYVQTFYVYISRGGVEGVQAFLDKNYSKKPKKQGRRKGGRRKRRPPTARDF